MKNLLILIFSTIIFNVSFAQELTKKEAIRFANQLYEIEILSKAGKAALIKKIKKNDVRIKTSTNLLTNHNYWLRYPIKSGIIDFLKTAFRHEFDYRMGFTETYVIEKTLKKNQNYSDNLFSEILKTKRSNFKGTQIERKITPDELGLNYREKPYYHPNTRYQNGGLIHPNRSAIGKHRKKTLDDLLTIGLIDSMAYDVTQSFHKYDFEFDMLDNLFGHYQWSDSQEKFKKENQKYLKSLHHLKLLSDENYKQVVTKVSNLAIEFQDELYPYFENALYVDVDNINSEKEEYQRIFSQIQRLIPQMNIQKIEYLTYETTDKEDIDYIKVTINDVEYFAPKRYFFHTSTRDFQEIDCIVIANKFLRDNQSKKRLSYNRLPIDEFKDNPKKHFWLFLFDKEQRKAVNYIWVDNFINYTNTFTTTTVNTALQTYQSIDLFHHLTAKQIELSILKVKLRLIDNYEEILFQFPNMFFYSYWDLENYKNPCEEVLDSFNRKIQEFTPINIDDAFAKYYDENYDSIYCSFQFNGRVYITDDLYEDGYSDIIIGLINKALLDNDVGKQIYFLKTDYEDVTVHIILSNEQYHTLSDEQSNLFNGYKDYDYDRGF